MALVQTFTGAQIAGTITVDAQNLYGIPRAEWEFKLELNGSSSITAITVSPLRSSMSGEANDWRAIQGLSTGNGDTAETHSYTGLTGGSTTADVIVTDDHALAASSTLRFVVTGTFHASDRLRVWVQGGRQGQRGLMELVSQ